MVNRYLKWVHAAAQREPVVGTAFLRVANLMATPTALFSPSVLLRVLRVAGRTAPEPAAVIAPAAV
jgi:hypothetical protein